MPIRCARAFDRSARGYLTAMGVRLLAGRELEPRPTRRRPDRDRRQPHRRAAALRHGQPDRTVRRVVSGSGKAAGRHRRRWSESSRTSATRRPIATRCRRSSSTTGNCSRSSSIGATRAQRQDDAGDRIPVVRGSHDGRSGPPRFPRSPGWCATSMPNAGIDSMMPMERLVASNRGAAALLRGDARRCSPASPASSPRSASTACSPTRWCSAPARSGSAWRSVRSACRCWRSCCATALILTAIGIAVGLAGAAAGTRLLQGMLFGITPLDPQTFVRGVAAVRPGRDGRVLPARPARDEGRSDGRAEKRIGTHRRSARCLKSGASRVPYRRAVSGNV